MTARHARGLKFLISPKIIHCPAIVFSLLLSSMPVVYKNLTHFFLLRLLRFKWIIIDQLFSLSHFPDVLKNKTYFHLWFHFFLTVLISSLMNNNFLFRLGSGNCIFTCFIVHFYLRQLKWVDKVYFAKFWIWTETMLSFCSSFCYVQFLVYSLDFSVTISLFWFSIGCFWSGLVQEQIKCGPITTSVYYDDFCQ